MNNDFEIAFNKLINATSKQIKNANRRAFRRVLTQVRKTAQSNLTSRVKGKASFKKDIRLTRFVDDKNSNGYSQAITIRSNKKKDSRSYLLTILEGGSYKAGKRRTKTYRGKKFRTIKRGDKRPKTHYRGKSIRPIKEQTGNKGKLEATNFFSDSVKQFDGQLNTILEIELQKAFSEIKI